MGHAQHLRHLTSAEAAEAIASEGVIYGSQAIYATSTKVTQPLVLRALTGANNTGGYVRIPATARAAFRPIPVSGPITAWTRWAGGGYVAQATRLDLATGATMPFQGIHKLTITDLGLNVAFQFTSQVNSGTIDPPFFVAHGRVVTGRICAKAPQGYIVTPVEDVPSLMLLPIQVNQQAGQ